MRRVALVLLLVLAGCASAQRLSASIYAHEQLARDLDASGEHGLAAAERAAAAHERDRLAGVTVYAAEARVSH